MEEGEILHVCVCVVFIYSKKKNKQTFSIFFLFFVYFLLEFSIGISHFMGKEKKKIQKKYTKKTKKKKQYNF